MIGRNKMMAYIRIILIFLTLFFCFNASLFAIDVHLYWDSYSTGHAWEKVRIYERNGTEGSYTYTLKTEVDGDQTDAYVTDVSPGIHVYIVRSYAQEIGESSNSNPASTSKCDLNADGIEADGNDLIEAIYQIFGVHSKSTCGRMNGTDNCSIQDLQILINVKNGRVSCP